MSRAIDAIDAFLADTESVRLEELKEFLRIPSVTVLSEHRDDVRAGAAWIAQHMRDIGLENVEVSETGGHPVVYADWLHAAGAPTVIVYAHYDVQPVRSPGPVAAPALRATHRRRAHLRSRQRRRQGPGAPSPLGRARLA